jgi:hypothetical protein
MQGDSSGVLIRQNVLFCLMSRKTGAGILGVSGLSQTPTLDKMICVKFSLERRGNDWTHGVRRNNKFQKLRGNRYARLSGYLHQ